jgi:hypothetical protein
VRHGYSALSIVRSPAIAPSEVSAHGHAGHHNLTVSRIREDVFVVGSGVAHTRLVVSPAAWLIATACLAVGCGTPEAPAVGPAPTGRTVTLTLQPYFRDLKTVRVSAGGRPLTMLLDTGGGATLVTPDLAKQIGCAPFGRDVGHRMTGEAVEFQRCETLTLSAGAWQRRIAPVGVFDIGRLLPPELPRLDGVLALDAFEGEVVTLDWAAGTVTIHGQADAPAALKRTGVPVRIATGDSGRFYSALLPVAAPRGGLWFLLDSGNIRGTLVARHVARDGRMHIAETGEAVLTIGARPPVTVRTEAADLDIDGALGTAWLLLGPVTLDLRTAAAR